MTPRREQGWRASLGRLIGRRPPTAAGDDATYLVLLSGRLAHEAVTLLGSGDRFGAIRHVRAVTNLGMVPAVRAVDHLAARSPSGPDGLDGVEYLLRRTYSVDGRPATLLLGRPQPIEGAGGAWAATVRLVDSAQDHGWHARVSGVDPLDAVLLALAEGREHLLAVRRDGARLTLHGADDLRLPAPESPSE